MLKGALFSSAVVTAVVLGCSSQSTDEGPCTKTQNGYACRSDGDCCSGNCRWQGGGFCQDAKLDPPPCQDALAACTQGSHCCSGVCQGDVCQGQTPSSSPPPPRTDGGQCKLPGAGCGAGPECCSGGCANGVCLGGIGKPDPGPCGGPFALCRIPDECCSGLCVSGRCK